MYILFGTYVLLLYFCIVKVKGTDNVHNDF